MSISEMKTIANFILEYNPTYTEEILYEFTYTELMRIVRDITIEALS